MNCLLSSYYICSLIKYSSLLFDSKKITITILYYKLFVYTDKCLSFSFRDLLFWKGNKNDPILSIRSIKS